MKLHYTVRIILLINMILFFSCTSSISLTISDHSPVSEKIIIVDDEGDGDYITINEAVNNTLSGDIIKVYSGIYFEEEIVITIPSITIKGIPYEYLNGTDLGTPRIIRKGYDDIFFVCSNEVIISNLIIEHEQENMSQTWSPLIELLHADNCTISNNQLGYCQVCIKSTYSSDVKIFNNSIEKADVAIWIESQKNEISENHITNSENGIYLKTAYFNIITNNWITLCNTSITVSHSKSNYISLNHMKENLRAMFLTYSDNNTIIQNNFIDNLEEIYIFNTKYIIFQKWSTVLNKWKENYWDNWKGFGPKILMGKLYILIPDLIWGFRTLSFNFFRFDWHPAREQYIIN